MTALRGDRRGDGGRGHGLRQWENDDLVPRPDDVFQERLYCVRWRLPSLAALLWAEQRSRAGGRLEDEAGGMPVPRTGTPVPGHLDSRLRGNDGAEVAGTMRAGGASVSEQDTPIPEGLRAEAPAGGVAAVLEGARRNFHAGGTPALPGCGPSPAGGTPAFSGCGPSPAGETPAFPEAPLSRHSRESGNPETPVPRGSTPIPGASGMPEVALRDAHAGEAPALRRSAPVPGGLRRDVDAEGPSAAPDASPPPVPEWVDPRMRDCDPGRTARSRRAARSRKAAQARLAGRRPRGRRGATRVRDQEERGLSEARVDGGGATAQESEGGGGSEKRSGRGACEVASGSAVPGRR